jgi:hypothetical protein
MVRRCGILHALLFQQTVAALQKPALEIGRLFAIAIVSDSLQRQLFAGWTNTGDPALVEFEVVLSEVARRLFRLAFLFALSVLLFLAFEVAVAAAKLVVRDIGVDAVLTIVNLGGKIPD